MSQWRGRFAGLWPVVFLVVTLWLVRYLRSAEFGLYEDDLTHIPTAVQMSGSELAQFAFGLFRNLSGQGTPLKLILWYALAHLGWSVAGLRGLYLLGFVVIAVNVSLFYLLMRQVSDQALAICASLAYVLYSADTTQAFLSHSFILQTSITMLLLALLLFHHGWRSLSYGLMFLALLTYETTFSVFLAAPLLLVPWDKEWRKGALRHVLRCGLIFAAVVLVRFAVGENRVGGLALRDAVFVPITNMIAGPLVALGTYAYRPVQAMQSMRLDVLLASVFGALCFTWLLWRVRPGFQATLEDLKAVPSRRTAGWDIPAGERAGHSRFGADLVSRLRLGLVGLVMLVLAYPLTFTVRPYAISGRDTRVHAAGVVGASMVVGSAIVIVIALAEGYRRKTWAIPALGIAIGILAGYGFVIQNDYATAWALQRGFWTQLIPLIPDVGDGTVVLVDPSGLQDTRQIGANYWNLPRVLAQLFVFPPTWEAKPRAYRLAEGWQERISTDDGKLRLDAATTLAPPGTYGVVDPSRAIFVGYRDGRLGRVSDEFLPGVGYPSPPPEEGEPPFPHGFLYDLMVLPADG